MRVGGVGIGVGLNEGKGSRGRMHLGGEREQRVSEVRWGWDGVRKERGRELTVFTGEEQGEEEETLGGSGRVTYWSIYAGQSAFQEGKRG